MDRKLQIVIIVVAAFMAFFMPVISDVIALVAWIYIVWNVWKKRTIEFDNQMEPENAGRLIRRLKAYLTVAGFSFVLFVTGAIVHNVLYGMTGTEDIVFLLLAIVAHVVFILATAVGLVLFLKARQHN
jgi:hypothetical protein